MGAAGLRAVAAVMPVGCGTRIRCKFSEAGLRAVAAVMQGRRLGSGARRRRNYKRAPIASRFLADSPHCVYIIDSDDGLHVPGEPDHGQSVAALGARNPTSCRATRS